MQPITKTASNHRLRQSHCLQCDTGHPFRHKGTAYRRNPVHTRISVSAEAIVCNAIQDTRFVTKAPPTAETLYTRALV